MQWEDRVYGSVAIDEPAILDLIECPTFRRLRGVRQAGPSALAFPFKDVTRHEHSLGVFVLLRRLGADRREQVAGLLHDISHTAFSHAVDFIFHSHEQDYHEKLKPVFLARPDVAAVLGRMGYAPEEFFDDSIYPLLEQPLPLLCADRLDYFFRDSLACAVSTPETVASALGHLVVVDRTIAFDDVEAARDTVARFATMNRDWWAGEVEAFIYNEFADALSEAFRIGCLGESDLLRDDAHVLSRLRSSGDRRIAQALGHIEHFHPGLLEGFVPRIAPKTRWIDPLIARDGRPVPLSEILGRGR
jgi:HD superfamily phosphohydrolase